MRRFCCQVSWTERKDSDALCKAISRDCGGTDTMRMTRLRHHHLHSTHSAAFYSSYKLKREELPVLDDKDVQEVTGIVYIAKRWGRGALIPSTVKMSTLCFRFCFSKSHRCMPSSRWERCFLNSFYIAMIILSFTSPLTSTAILASPECSNGTNLGTFEASFGWALFRDMPRSDMRG